MTTQKLVPATIPTLKPGYDAAEISSQFKSSFADAQSALQRVIAFGIFAAHVKFNCLKHGQFGGWVKGECGEKAYRSVRSYLNLTDGVLKACGVRSLKAAVSKWQTLPICHRGEFLLANAANIPEAVQPLRDKVLKLIENKTQRQLFFEFKQAEEDEEGNARVKRGRLKGQGGATAAQRAARAAANAALEKAALELQTKATIKWLKANCVDDKIGTQLSDATLQAFNDWCKVGFDYSARILNARLHAK